MHSACSTHTISAEGSYFENMSQKYLACEESWPEVIRNAALSHWPPKSILKFKFPKYNPSQELSMSKYSIYGADSLPRPRYIAILRMTHTCQRFSTSHKTLCLPRFLTRVRSLAPAMHTQVSDLQIWRISCTCHTKNTSCPKTFTDTRHNDPFKLENRRRPLRTSLCNRNEHRNLTKELSRDPAQIRPGVRVRTPNQTRPLLLLLLSKPLPLKYHFQFQGCSRVWKLTTI